MLSSFIFSLNSFISKLYIVAALLALRRIDEMGDWDLYCALCAACFSFYEPILPEDGISHDDGEGYDGTTITEEGWCLI